MPAKHDITGQRFGRLVAVERTNFRTPTGYAWRARCDCGGETVTSISSLRRGHTKSCGCLHRESCIERSTRHGFASREGRNKLYGTWKAMRQRCNDTRASNYKYYGGRGIAICPEWSEYKAFHDWAVSNGYDDSLSIDRIDPNGNYEPSNCRWADKKTQTNNRRMSALITIHGETMTRREVCEKYGVVYSSFGARIRKGMTPEQAIC